MIKEVSKLQYIYADSHLDGDSVKGQFVLKTRFKEPFFAAVAKIIEQNKAQK